MENKTTVGLTYSELKEFQQILTKANYQQLQLLVSETLRQIQKRERQIKVNKKLGGY